MRLIPRLLRLIPVVALVAIGTASTVQQATPTPMELFSKMLPVIRHNRCINCHGDVDPISGKDHMGGSIDTKVTQCTKCHMKGWQLPSPSHFWPGKSDRELCGMFSDFAAMQGHDKFINGHLRADELVVAGFEGKMGGVGDMGGFRDPTDQPLRPPNTQEEFIDFAKDWLARGQGACDVEGTITLIETVESLDTWHMTPITDDMVKQEGTRTVTIKLSGGVYQAEIKMTGTIVGTHVTHTTDARGRPCTSTLVTTKTYSGQGKGPARVTAKDTIFLPGVGKPDPRITDYRIDVVLPVEKGTSHQVPQMSNTCGMASPTLDPGDEDYEWDPAAFTLEGHDRPTTTRNLVGSCDRLVTVADKGTTQAMAVMDCNRFGNLGNAESPGLTRLADIQYHDNRQIQFRSQTFWNIRYRK